jgi:cytosine/adenosine deaminase-related metal-dependent hydrolase
MLAFEVTERNTRKEADRGLKENTRFAKSLTRGGLTSMMVSIHASFTVTDEVIAAAERTATSLGVPLTIHTSEGLVDLYHNLETFGERTVERLHRTGVLRKGTVLAHCVHLDRHELDLIGQSGAAVAHNPMSNMLNGVGVAPVPEMLSRGITVGLGNDGWVFDPFENMRCAMTVHRLAARNPSVIGPAEVFRMATLDGARCYGLDSSIGSLERGKLADVVVLDGTRVATPLDKESVISHIVNSFSGADVRDVFINGKLTLRNRKLTQVSDTEVANVSRASARNLWTRLAASTVTFAS